MSEAYYESTGDELYGDQLDFGKGKTGRRWLEEFRGDLSSIVDGLDVWQDTAYSIACEAMDCNFSPGTRLTVPLWFQNLTSIIALWCDVELHIDPAPLCEFRRKMLNLVPRNRLMPDGKVGMYRVAMTDFEIETLLWTARETFDRVFHATLARGTKEEQHKVMKIRGSKRWWHEPAEERPAEYKFGPTPGTKAELSLWLGEKKTKTPRRLEQKAKSGLVWVVRHAETSWDMWFKDQVTFEAVTRKRLYG